MKFTFKCLQDGNREIIIVFLCGSGLLSDKISPMNRFLLIGLDGAEPGLVEPWMDEGILPNLAALRSRGCFLPLESTCPPATFPAWTSCVTGVGPGQHGIFDFTELIPGEYAIRFVNASYRKAPAVWKVLSDADKRVVVLGVPGTYPPEPVNGVMLSGFDSPVTTRIDTSFVFPRRMYEQVSDWQFADFQENFITPGWHEKALQSLLRGIEIKESIAVRLMKREPWDFFMLVFGESDTVSHHFWMFHDAKSPRHRPGFPDAIRKVYQRLDTAVGRLINTMGDDVVVGLVSDHGFGGAGTGVVHLNNWLASKNYLAFKHSHDSILKKIALRYTPASLQGPLFRRMSGLAARAESSSRFGGIDWSRTRAWSEELNYMPSVRVNLKGREPLGQVAVKDYDRFVADLCTELESWDVIECAWPREVLYTGSWVEKAPDIILELALEDGYSYNCLRSRGGPPYRRIDSVNHIGAKGQGMSGNHRNPGVFMFSEAVLKDRPHLVDIAPTILSVLDVAGPTMDGQSLYNIDVQTPDIPNTPSIKSTEERHYTSDEEEIVEKRLRSLGYLE